MTNGGSGDIEGPGTRYFYLDPIIISLRSNLDVIPIYSAGCVVSGGYVSNDVIEFLKNKI